MLSMGIDLEQPSAECHNRQNRMNASVDVADYSDEGLGREGATNQTRNYEANAGSSGSGRVLDGGQNANAGDGISLNSVKDLEPARDGMEFESKEEAFSFYKEYAKSVGFAAIIKSSRRSRITGKFIDAKFVCTRYGTGRETVEPEMPQPLLNADGSTSIPAKRKRGRTNRSLTKTDCKASMHVKRRKLDGKWVVSSFMQEHNHEIYPNQAYFFRGDRNLDLANNNVDGLRAIGARMKKLYVDMPRQSSGCKKQDKQKSAVSNQSGSTQHLALEEEDTRIMLDHFMCMQDENPNFFYAIDLDGELGLRNVFWVDAKGRLDYGHFSDVLFFDTTYIKNEYKLPFAPFIGVNHHFQLLLLGSSLLAEETKATYVWLMRAWLKAMDGRAPRVILTDQDKCLKEAIAEVFPNSRHCFCLWHILSKIPEKLGYLARQLDNFMTKFKKCIFRSWTNEQFEKRWWKMVERFNLKSNIWFQSLYEDRGKWVPTYMRDSFLGGLSTTQRSENVSCFFDKYMQRRMSLKEFLEQHKAVLREKLEEEAKADFETWHKQPVLKSPSPFGKQMANLYTHAMFKKFQVEVLGVVACHPRKESEDGETKTFRIQDFEENQDFVVVWNERTPYLSCSCRSFEFNGFLCRHVLIVMQISGVQCIPSQYVLKRWTKDAKSRQTLREQSDMILSRVQRYNELYRQAMKLGDEGSLCQESYNIAFHALEAALRKCELVNNSIHSVTETMSPSSNGPRVYKNVSEDDAACNTNKKNGLSRKRQAPPEPEVMTIGIQESWQQTEQLNSRVPSLDGYFGPQHIEQTMGQLNSTASVHDEDYCRNQRSMQGLGQLNSIALAPTHEATCTTPQRMNGTGQLHLRPQTVPSCFNIEDGLHEMNHSNVQHSQFQSTASKQKQNSQ